MNNQDLDKAYVSPYDSFFFEFDAHHAKSESQIKEIEKHARIARMRDDAHYQDEAGGIWEGF